MKLCKKCGRELPIEYFRKCKGAKDGHRNDCRDCEKQYQLEHREISRRASKTWKEKHPLENRAHSLVTNYKREDRKYNRGECNLTAKWIVENIFSKPCAHCGKEGWSVIGCNRLDNSKPHSKDNVEPCCFECNHTLAVPYLSKLNSIPLDQIHSVTGEIINSWSSASQASKELSMTSSRILDCCNGGYFDHRRNKWVNIHKYKGYIWKHIT